MSERIWLGEGIESWADQNLSEYPSVDDLAEYCATRFSFMKAYAPDRSIMAIFLNHMAEHGIIADDFWGLYIGESGHCEEYFSTPLRGSLESMELMAEVMAAAERSTE